MEKLWYDGDTNRPVRARIKGGISHYQAKGLEVKGCYVNPKTLGDKPPSTVSKVPVFPIRNVIPGHFRFVVVN